MAPENFDLIVIGSGPAGEKGAAQAAYFGKRVALIEKEPVLGGTAANTGTLPSKTLRETALYLSGFRNRDLFGLDVRLKPKVSLRDFLGRERLIKENERQRIQENLKRHHIVQYAGTASFVDSHTVAVQPTRSPGIQIRGEVILIATGSYPNRPPNFPFHDPRIYDSDTILDLQEIPESMLVVGGGVVGCEYACMFAALGIRVALVERRERIIGFLDAEVGAALTDRMRDLGIALYLSDAVAEVDDRPEVIEVRLTSGATLKVETVLVSAGRSGHTESLGLDRVGIAVTDRGHIKVNDLFQTSLPHVYAAGDVIGNPALASTSMEQGRIAMVHAFELRYREGLPRILPFGVYTIPEVSMAGETEESLIAKKVPYVVGKAAYAQNARGQIIGDREGFLKLLFAEQDLKLLGVHMIGEQATELVHIGLSALLMNEDADLFIHTCFNYPTLSEMYKYATYDAMGRRAARREGKPLEEQKTGDRRGE